MGVKFWQQILVFGAVFLLLLIGMEWLRGVPLTGEVLLSAAGSALVATLVYGVIGYWLEKRRKRGDDT
ncbi:MAG TPA: hypothetical protein DEA05_02060 [Rhodobacteraceae bacterium]|nr:hypothetical protein [Paracoccaceae bacterium]